MEAYNKIFQGYEKKDYIRQVLQSEVEKQWFLPHFPVVKEDRVMTKVRVVFDAVVKHNGKSLNDAIWPGPKLQRDLVDVLTRFHRVPVALSADIYEMFLQVELQEKDRPYHRFLWRDFDTSREPDVYVSATIVWKHRFTILFRVCPSDPCQDTRFGLSSSSKHH